MSKVNRFEVKREMYDRLSDIVGSLESMIDSMEQEIRELSEMPECDRGWRADYLNSYPNKIEAYKAIIAYLEKLL